ncbi:DUF2306 domain-containing protein [Paenibacillus sp. R14(2021)]|uniref:DUF2306 domain-containing protein n=1 Tax=Paenibacillus sp. R14(2021) TaxID=2859228 RepID=UPI001C614B0C|nr:DUF2306 domain-containing protein [Paenibacillus sp. R14(2021)]
MTKHKLPYLLLLAAAVLFILYVLYANILHDPEASGFLGHKDNPAHPVNMPVWLPVMRVHLAFACLALLSGAVNFPERLRRKRRKFHKRNGYLYVISVLIVSLTSGYMAPYATGGKAVSIAFNILNIIWPAFTLLAVMRIRKQRIVQHRQWMARSYALCFTNMLVHLLTYVLNQAVDISYPLSYTAAVYSAIIVLLAAAEIVVRVFFKGPVIR